MNRGHVPSRLVAIAGQVIGCKNVGRVEAVVPLYITALVPLFQNNLL